MCVVRVRVGVEVGVAVGVRAVYDQCTCKLCVVHMVRCMCV